MIIWVRMDLVYHQIGLYIFQRLTLHYRRGIQPILPVFRQKIHKALFQFQRYFLGLSFHMGQYEIIYDKDYHIMIKLPFISLQILLI
jgi:hypothetical protein